MGKTAQQNFQTGMWLETSPLNMTCLSLLPPHLPFALLSHCTPTLACHPSLLPSISLCCFAFHVAAFSMLERLPPGTAHSMANNKPCLSFSWELCVRLYSISLTAKQLLPPSPASCHYRALPPHACATHRRRRTPSGTLLRASALCRQYPPFNSSQRPLLVKAWWHFVVRG